MRKGISLGTAIILAGFLGITLPGCSDDKNTSGTGGDAAKSSGGATGSKSSPGGGSSASWNRVRNYWTWKQWISRKQLWR